MNMGPLKALVIGCGSIGKRHIRNLLALKEVSVTICDTSPSRRREAEEFHIPVFEKLDQAWGTAPDMALITVPTSLHIPIAQEAAEQGCHVFIEKPLGDRWDGVEKLIETIRERRLVSLVGCNLRFHPGLRNIKMLL